MGGGGWCSVDVKLTLLSLDVHARPVATLTAARLRACCQQRNANALAQSCGRAKRNKERCGCALGVGVFHTVSEPVSIVKLLIPTLRAGRPRT
jgi:hypothetical protein